MKNAGEFIVDALVSGLLVIVPVYLAIVLLLKEMQSVAGPHPAAGGVACRRFPPKPCRPWSSWWSSASSWVPRFGRR
jgi:hypothetical protein